MFLGEVENVIGLSVSFGLVMWVGYGWCYFGLLFFFNDILIGWQVCIGLGGMCIDIVGWVVGLGVFYLFKLG